MHIPHWSSICCSRGQTNEFLVATHLSCVWVLCVPYIIMVTLEIPHEGYNTYTLENHSTADLYYDAIDLTFEGINYT